MNPIHIQATDISDAWFQCLSSLLENGNRYVIMQGSYEGQTRLEFDFATILIKFPYAEPWDNMLPKIPEHLGIPNPVANGYIEQYVPYLMTEHIQPGEQYTYGGRICRQISFMIDRLRKTPNTNQAILQVGKPSDCFLEDPPCLRHIDIRVNKGQLLMFPYFRSWDLWGGFPANLAGIAVLQKYMADEIGLEAGPILASSKGLHVYGYVEDLVKLRVGK